MRGRFFGDEPLKALECTYAKCNVADAAVYLTCNHFSDLDNVPNVHFRMVNEHSGFLRGKKRKYKAFAPNERIIYANLSTVGSAKDALLRRCRFDL